MKKKIAAMLTLMVVGAGLAYAVNCSTSSSRDCDGLSAGTSVTSDGTCTYPYTHTGFHVWTIGTTPTKSWVTWVADGIGLDNYFDTIADLCKANCGATTHTCFAGYAIPAPCVIDGTQTGHAPSGNCCPDPDCYY